MFCINVAKRNWQRAVEQSFRDSTGYEALGDAHPAWTAVGTSGLWNESYVVEIQMIAYAPLA